MTISSLTPTRLLHDRLARLEACALHAPEGTYEGAKTLVRALEGAVDAAVASLEGSGLKTSSADLARDLAANVFGYVIASDPDLGLDLATAEGFGEHVMRPGETRDRVIAQTVRDRDYLKKMTEPAR